MESISPWGTVKCGHYKHVVFFCMQVALGAGVYKVTAELYGDNKMLGFPGFTASQGDTFCPM